jgi:hypothetical protein
LVRCARDRSLLSIARAAAIMIQSHSRTRREMRKLNRALVAVRVLQALARRRRAQRRLEWKRGRRFAACCIQSSWRASTARFSWTKARVAAIMIQSSLRASQASSSYRRLVQLYVQCAVTIQTAWRGFHCRLSFLIYRTSIISIQALLRSHLEHAQYSSIQASTLKVQKTWRRSKVRRMLQLEQLHAGILIQSLARRFLVASKYQNLLNNRRVVQAAVAIQSTWRCIDARTTLATSRTAAIIIQATIRQRQASLNLLSKQRGALCLQRHIRRLAAENEFRRCKAAVIRVQSSWRTSFARSEFQRARAAAILLQSIARTYQEKQVACLQSASVKIQSLRRCYCTRWRFTQAVRAATLIQAWLRRWHAQEKYIVLCSALILIQASFRRHLCSKRFIETTDVSARDSAATIIGAAWRRGETQARLKRVTVSCVMLQGAVRMAQARSRFKGLRNATLRLQADHRCLRAKVNLCQARKAAIRIQSWWRWNMATYRFTAAKFLVVQFQAFWRGALLRSRVRRINLAAYKIQAVYQIASEARRRSAFARLIQGFWRKHSSCQRYACWNEASRTIQRWYLCVKVKRQLLRLKSSVALLNGYLEGTLPRTTTCFALLQVNIIRMSPTIRSVLNNDRRGNDSRSSPEFMIEWNQAMDDAKLCATIILQGVARSFFSRRALARADGGERDDCRPKTYARRCVAVRVLTRLTESSLGVELCTLLHRQRHDAARKLQRFFTVCVRREAKASHCRVEAELVALRAERAAQRTVASVLVGDSDFAGDPKLQVLGLCIPRLALRARAARMHLFETKQSLSRRNDTTQNQTKTSVEHASHRAIDHKEAWYY